MYNLFQIRRVGLIHIVGGLVVALTGFLVEILFTGKTDLVGVLLSDLATLAVFGIGWYLFNQVVMGQTYSSLIKGLTFSREPMKRLKEPPIPARRMGMDFQTLEISAMVLAAVLVAIVTLLVGRGGSFSLGSFAAGWLLGGGLGRLRFFKKVSKQEQEQERTFYFSDTTAGPRTDLAFYEAKPGRRTLEEAQRQSNQPLKVTSDAALPPGVRRRAGETGKTGGGVRKQAKAAPIASNPKPQGTSSSKTEDKK